MAIAAWPGASQSGVVAERKGHGFGSTPLAHELQALRIDPGADPRAVAERLGYSSVVLTLNTYSHLFETRDAELTDALDATYEGR